MPQASEELRSKMKRYFGDAIDDQGPTKFLNENKWKEVNNGLWVSPNPWGDSPEKERICMIFLIEEWDHDYLGQDQEECVKNG